MRALSGLFTHLSLVLLVACGGLLMTGCAPDAPPLRIGVIHSRTGTLAVSERPLIDAVTLAVEEINRGGGLLGRRVEIVLADGRSDPAVFAAAAERLIADEKVAALFGGWTSSSRLAMKPVVERHAHLLFYPVQYEGLEQSPNIVYLGSVPNQQILPALTWARKTLGKRFYLVGSDYVFPRTAHRLIRDLAGLKGDEIVGERLLPLGATDFASVIADIQRQKPDVILNTVNGDSNAALFDALSRAGLATPILSFSVAEPEMRAWGGGKLPHHYVAWHYLQSLAEQRNVDFVARYRARFGADRMIGAPAEAAYTAVRLWAKTVVREGSAEPQRVNAASLFRQTIEGPSGPVSVDAATRHAWRVCRIGKAKPDGQIDVVYATPTTLRAEPWPLNKSRREWQTWRVSQEHGR